MPSRPFHLPEIPDPLLSEAYDFAARQSVLPCIHNEVRFGHWTVCANGGDFGLPYSYPTLDGHHIADALLWLGVRDEVRANWDYVRSFQRADGLTPIAILPGLSEAGGSPACPNLKAPVDARGGFYRHWVPGDPLRPAAAPSQIQNADSFFRHTQDAAWLEHQIPSLNLSGEYLAGLTTPEGAVGGAGYYVERPVRIEYDGVSQGHAADAFELLAALNRRVGHESDARRWDELAQRIRRYFRSVFWVGSQFAEYLHPQRGLIATHGLSDSDWTAMAFGMGTPEQERVLWPQLRDEARLWYGGMPTGIAARPEAYEAWEFSVPDRHDLAAMGRTWFVEARARARMGDAAGLIESLRHVAQVGREAGYYSRERYHPNPGGGCTAAGAEQYVEYPANLIRSLHRYVFGIEMGLDGSLMIRPCVLPSWLDRGFGQTLEWAGRRLTFRIQGGTISGSYLGAVPLKVEVTLDRAAPPVRIDLPASSDARKFEANARR